MKITGIALAVVGALAIVAPSFAGAGGAPILASPLAVGKMRATTIHATTGGMILESIKIAPGVHLGRNDTKARVTLYAMYLGVSNFAKANFAVAAPAGCNA